MTQVLLIFGSKHIHSANIKKKKKKRNINKLPTLSKEDCSGELSCCKPSVLPHSQSNLLDLDLVTGKVFQDGALCGLLLLSASRHDVCILNGGFSFDSSMDSVYTIRSGIYLYRFQELYKDRVE